MKISLIRHEPIPKTGSYEVRFPTGGRRVTSIGATSPVGGAGPKLGRRRDRRIRGEGVRPFRAGKASAKWIGKMTGAVEPGDSGISPPVGVLVNRSVIAVANMREVSGGSAGRRS
jgi:hypothetical protein